MPKKARLLVVDSNLHTLSKIYLGLIHKNYKVEATDDAREINARAERFKPRLVILNAATDSLTPEVYRQLAEKRIYVLLIAGSNQQVPQMKKMEVISMPSDISFFDVKIREVLNIF